MEQRMADALMVLRTERAQAASTVARLDRAIAALLGREEGGKSVGKTEGVKAFRRSTPKLRQKAGPLNGMDQQKQVLHILTGAEPRTAKAIFVESRKQGGTLRSAASVSAVLSTLQHKKLVAKDCTSRPCTYKLAS